MNKRGILTGEKEDLQEFITHFFKAQDKKEVPTIDEEMDIILPITSDEQVKILKGLATNYDLKFYIITP